jgi:hypothetical protein
MNGEEAAAHGDTCEHLLARLVSPSAGGGHELVACSGSLGGKIAVTDERAEWLHDRGSEIESGRGSTTTRPATTPTSSKTQTASSLSCSNGQARRAAPDHVPSSARPEAALTRGPVGCKRTRRLRLVGRSEDELVGLLLARASGVKQKCRHADSSRGRVPNGTAAGTRTGIQQSPASANPS